MQCGKDCDYICNSAMYWGSSASLRKGIKYSYLCKLFFLWYFFTSVFRRNPTICRSLLCMRNNLHRLFDFMIYEIIHNLDIAKVRERGDTKLVWKKGLKPKIGLSFNNFCGLTITFTFFKIKLIKDVKMLSWLKQSALKSNRVPFRYLHLKMPNF
jgi:hypothetical protein